MDNCVRQLPPFNTDIAGWFQHIEAAFAASTDLTDDQKYYAVIVSIPTHVATRIAPTLAALPSEGRYQALKQALLQALGPTRESHLHALEGARYEGGRPSLLLQRLQALNTAAESPYSEDMVRFRWLALLPASLRVLLTTSAPKSLQDCGNLADSIFFAQQQQQLVQPDSAPYATPHVNSVVNQCSPSFLDPLCSAGVTDGSRVRHSSELSPAATVAPSRDFPQATDAVLGAVLDPRLRQPQSQAGQDPAQSLARLADQIAGLQATLARLQPLHTPSQAREAPGYCFYHRKFGAAARNCQAPCSWAGNGRRGGW